MKIAVYTFISGFYDSLKPFNKEFNKEADFYLFTDTPQVPSGESGKYQIVIVPILKGYERYTARYYKILSHLVFPNYDYIIWVDGTVTLKTNPRLLIEKYLHNVDVAAFKYPDEDCIYIHAKKCAAANRISISDIAPQMEYYKSVGFPEHEGLCELRVVLRKNTEEVKRLNTLWFDEYKKYLTCDQLVFNYCLWKLKMKYNTIEWGSPEFVTEKLHAQYRPHRYIK